ncbi:cyclopropane-fatty-acyl-phospholipid synthase [Rhodococcus maanshanensis]|uniref:Cyclopropane-fatty-acyl-phospholipid synthase n=1 Tax=Rhodococcus maanshanensis TaxID=183556 RepID=A0A1H7NSN8_9NOCA|nr:cyclopropane-fatty-acyl-phospholipid synthase [Rhodococcus maanshanensis]
MTAERVRTDIDDRIWPGLADTPAGPRARFLAAGADRLFRRAAGRLEIRVEYPDGAIVGAGDRRDILPRMIIRRPDAFAARLADGGLIGFGEAYMAGDWTAPDLAAVLTAFAAGVETLVPRPLQRLRRLFAAAQPAGELGTEQNARSNVSRHYDLSNELFELFLDETMTYSAALFDGGQIGWDQLANAQRRKVDRLLDAAGVGPGTRLLEIGTGWGELCIRAARRGATVRSVTLSTQQQALARRRVAEAGHADSVWIDLLDYRAVEGEYDAIVSVEMIEAVGHRFWETYFATLDRLLAPDGTVALQAITMAHDRMLATRDTYTWVHKYIFPGGCLPSTQAIEAVTSRHTTLRVRELTSMGLHYAETLRLWKERFAARGAEVAALGFDEIFRRMWLFYLAYSEAGFRSAYLDVQQIVLDRGTGPR